MFPNLVSVKLAKVARPTVAGAEGDSATTAGEKW